MSIDSSNPDPETHSEEVFILACPDRSLGCQLANGWEWMNFLTT
ncbi:hypothetical protein JOD45_001190 [Scopulibacillus daqui]|uniref:Uncharacterized protein n=1 Tax=Scopulibacillus daqui TaxID=1469162 RepID=A0ABS2PYF2_9BACL|nr:hypothetical protein [Scopulibacillus daqui]